VTYTVCGSAGAPFSVSGCTPKDCVQPTSTFGYDLWNVVENLDYAAWNAGSVTGITCKASDGFIGTPAVSKCGSPNTAYTLSGCHDVCATSVPTTGYDVTNRVESSLSRSTFWVTGITCAAGFVGSPVVTKCSLGGEAYTLSGCVEETAQFCVRPTTTVGYDYNTVTSENLDFSTFSVVGLTCEPKYGPGSPTITKCATPNTEYTISGCSDECTTPSTAGYDFSAEAGDRNIFSHGVVGITCAPGYHGHPVTTACNKGGEPYHVAGCVADCTTPVSSAFKTVGETGSKSLHDFSVSGLTCNEDNHYMGTPVVSVCSAPGSPYQVTGCTGICTHPTEASLTGYIVTNVNLSQSSFTATVQCDYHYKRVDYVTAPSATVCGVSGSAYTLSGCTPKDCTLPETIPEGYNLHEVDGNLNFKNPNTITGYTCAQGFSGSAIANVCQVEGDVYTLSGCTAEADSEEEETTEGAGEGMLALLGVIVLAVIVFLVVVVQCIRARSDHIVVTPQKYQVRPNEIRPNEKI